MTSPDQTPPPGLELLFVARGTLGAPIALGRVPGGERIIVPVPAGGRFEGPLMSGRMLDGAADVQLVRDDGVVELEAHGVLETDDGVRILYRNSGIRWFPDEVAAAMREGRPFDPALVYSRAAPRFEAPADSAYAWLNRSLFLSIPARDGAGIKLTVWRVT
ncbi:MAG: hypothetical protein JWM75_244 [Sphingomonas bacterium]|nr:hypothetical protein [Sphingomonas bacterium]